MPYLLQGDTQRFFEVFDGSRYLSETNDRETLDKDLTQRNRFLGTNTQANLFFNLWSRSGRENFYTQGNMTASVLSYFLCTPGSGEPLKTEDDDDEQYHAHFVRQGFAYQDDEGQPCGLMIMYRRDKPDIWAIGFMRNAHLEHKDREVILLSSVDPTQYMVNPDPEMVVVAATDLDPRLLGRLNAAIPHTLLQALFTAPDGAINVHARRLDFLLRPLMPIKDKVEIRDPINFSRLDVQNLFADNSVLDLLIDYGVATTIPLSFAMLRECLSQDSALCKELARVALHGDRAVVSRVLQMTMVYYEAEMLDANRDLLKDLEFIKAYRGFMLDRTRIKLISFMYKNRAAYNDKLMTTILGEEAYYSAVNHLVEMGYTEDIPAFFQDQDKLKELKQILEFKNADTQKLCLVFWVKGSLTQDGYAQIAAAAEQYPLMASTLVARDKTGIIRTVNDLEGSVPKEVSGLWTLALQPKKHLKKSIVHHFFPEEDEKHYVRTSGLEQLNLDELDSACKALSILADLKQELEENELNSVSRAIDILVEFQLELADKTITYPKAFTVLSDLKKELHKRKQEFARNPHDALVHLQTKLGPNKLRAILKRLDELSKDTTHGLSKQNLESAKKALTTLSTLKIEDRTRFRLVINKDNKGQALRLLLPQLADVADTAKRQELIKVLYASVNLDIPVQGQALEAIKDPEQLVLAKKLQERFICVNQLQDLKTKTEAIVLHELTDEEQAVVSRNLKAEEQAIIFAAERDNKMAARFRQIIIQVEKQCGVVSERVSASGSLSMKRDWEAAEANYRSELYRIAYHVLTSPTADMRTHFSAAKKRIKEEEKKLLLIVEPTINSTLHKALLVIADVLIALLSLGIANLIKRQQTGNSLFFNQTRSGEDVRALGKKVNGLIEPEPEPTHNSFGFAI